ncbi:hypothetical protein [Tenacibaculum agarivorans]|uniref:hypothetical protein n=1 Tax=Tenacibaculum agarivorans TaxID=1908389 RepID=UPI00094BB03B|nr:hypothetical protein [Tenacibaculum agarivorans]
MKKNILLLINLLIINFLYSQSIEVTLDFSHKHVVGTVDTFERSKFITIHSANHEELTAGQQKLMEYLINDLEVYYGREAGTLTNFGPLYPEKHIKGLQDYNTYYKQNHFAHQLEKAQELVLAGQYSLYDVFVSAAKDNHALAGKNYGAYVCDYLRNVNGTGGINGLPRAKYIELLNEPLWEQIDQYIVWKGGGPNKEEEKVILSEIFTFHKEAAKEIHRQLPGTKVGGFAEAWPDPESRDFFNWETRWKTFIDDNGADMDYFSFHLYDKHCLGTKKTYRMGGNLEAFMDLLSHYSHLTLGKEKPFLITEYGGRSHCYENSGTRSDIHDWLFTSSMNAMMMQFMDRTDMIEKAIPYIMAIWTPEWNIFRLDLPINKQDVFSEYIKFYELWKGVNGTRKVTTSTDLDLQVDAYSDGNKTYLILNNIDNKAVTVNVKELGLLKNEISNITSRHFHYKNSDFKLDTNTYKNLPKKLKIGGFGTRILVYETKNTPDIEFTSTETRNYATEYKKKITKNTAIHFDINSINKGMNGAALLKLGLGRDHGLSLQPKVKINEELLSVPRDLRGDAQTDKASFFGMLEIKVPHNLIKENNIVTVEFPDTGGYITSVVLRSFNMNKGNVKVTKKSL